MQSAQENTVKFHGISSVGIAMYKSGTMWVPSKARVNNHGFIKVTGKRRYVLYSFAPQGARPSHG